MHLTEKDCPALLASSLSIGDVQIKNRIFSAPMSGVSDIPYQKRVSESGAGLVFSEMAASHLLIQETASKKNKHIDFLQNKLLTKTNSKDVLNQSPHAVQIFGRAPSAMALTAKMAEAEGAALIDINMGCPAKKLAQKHKKNGEAVACGAALMQDENLATEIITAVVNSVSVPVSVKMRLGWDETAINAPQLAAQAVGAGAKMITIHARTRAQFYKGQADWAKVKAVRDAIDEVAQNIILIINGDIHTVKNATDALNQSKADGIMIGRAAYGQPWITGGLGNEKKPKLLLTYILDHYHAMLKYYGETRGIRHARKHLDWYLQKQALGLYTHEERAEIMATKNSDQVEKILQNIFARLN